MKKRERCFFREYDAMLFHVGEEPVGSTDMGTLRTEEAVVNLVKSLVRPGYLVWVKIHEHRPHVGYRVTGLEIYSHPDDLSVAVNGGSRLLRRRHYTVSEDEQGEITILPVPEDSVRAVFRAPEVEGR